MSHYRRVLLHNLRPLDADCLKPIGGVERWGVPFTIRREWMLASPSLGRNFRELVRKLRRWWRRGLSADFRRHFPNPTTRGSVEDCCSWCVQTFHLIHVRLILDTDPILLVLGLTQTIFEGSMYLFVFIWVPTLQESSLDSASLPLGYIFSAFMISMMLGSLLYTYITAHWYPPPTTSGPQKHTRSTSVASLSAQGDSSLTLHAQLSSLVCAASAVTFAACVSIGKGKGEQEEHLKFWAFCLFEACVGMYYPVQGMLRGSLIANEHRATVSPLPTGYIEMCSEYGLQLSALFRVPLNVFVVVSLLTGVSSAREAVLTTCAIVLAISSLTTALVVIPRIEAPLQNRIA